MQNKSLIKNNILQFIENKGVSKYKFYQETGITRGILGQNNGMSEENTARFLAFYSEVSAEWLLTGKGEMLKSNQEQTIDQSSIKEDDFNGGSPFYEDLPISAGKTDQVLVSNERKKPTGHLKIPGINPIAYFPVIGCSLKPDINLGDIVGVNMVDKWDMVDPDKVYMIITHEDRMIKHLKIDKDRDDMLWCISPNYDDFPIYKDDIKAIYRIVFTGKLM